MTQNLERLLDIMARLRDPERGCPWDVRQSFASIAPYTIEEAYEVADAIERDDRDDLRDELGDLLLQVVFHARMAQEEDSFDFDDVARAIADKLVRRHPHVFQGARYESETEQKAAWERQKAEERAAKKTAGDGALADVPTALPALLRAAKLGKRAARAGFDWPDPAAVMDKIHEEIAELRAEITDAPDPDRLQHELGDLLFACAQLGRHLGADPESALRSANARFERRFRSIEAALADDGRSAHDAAMDELERLWQAAKRRESAGVGHSSESS